MIIYMEKLIESLRLRVDELLIYLDHLELPSALYSYVPRHYMPARGTQLYNDVIAGLLLAIVLVLVWLLFNMRSKRLDEKPVSGEVAEITFEDISAEAAAQTAAQTVANVQTPDMSPEAVPNLEPIKEGSNSEGEAGGFHFFKRKTKSVPEPHELLASASSDLSADGAALQNDDTFLIELEQEMLATRQLYLDGQITKEVYVMETRALYQKAQSHMT
jgi:hypothetical protein